MKFCFFWDGPFSQWSRSPFEACGYKYGCAEQWMMHQKALLFADYECAEAILSSTTPRQQKELGRKVKGFDKVIWESRARNIVYLGNVFKFSQNKEHLKALLGTGDLILAEASPYDKIWGIGLKASDPAAQDQGRWRGANWLGQVLMEVRRAFRFGMAPALLPFDHVEDA